jgi:hypothetical protein
VHHKVSPQQRCLGLCQEQKCHGSTKLLLFVRTTPSITCNSSSRFLPSVESIVRSRALPRDQLELLEDKLREYRALDDHQQEDKVGRHPPLGTVHLRCSPCGYPVQALDCMLSGSG